MPIPPVHIQPIHIHSGKETKKKKKEQTNRKFWHWCLHPLASYVVNAIDFPMTPGYKIAEETDEKKKKKKSKLGKIS
ncbi:hypothetical protein VN97_g11094 [Penicillium thymicola]|uniref:Uncharacterized protein n=1 Tax=Penicillium thymicola TaxID=293382 RepID=A0AAI9T7R3_PENTH|nr:hypothetical protein VN97_g11094 [Penicillium thymicola]